MSASKSYEKKVNIAEIKNDIKSDSDKISEKSRFGYFSIKYPAFTGDEFYSSSKKKRTDENKKVITEPRGIYSQPTKVDKHPASFFTNSFKQDPSTLKRISEEEHKERQDYINHVKQKKTSEYKKAHFQEIFKPSGPKEYKELFDFPDQKVVYKVPVDKPVDRFSRIDKERHKVITENRGIYSRGPKKGTSAYPGILFSFSTLGPTDYKKELKNRNNSAKVIQKGKKEYERPFVPASLKKCDTFLTAKQQFGEDPKKIEALIDENTKKKHEKGQKYIKRLPEGSMQHLKEFTPSNLVKTGIDTLFHTNLVRNNKEWRAPVLPPEKKEIKIHSKEQKKFVEKFKPNRLVDSSTFSPTIANAIGNIKREFASVFKY